MALWKNLAVLLLLTLAIQNILAEDDDVLVENDEIEEVESKPEVDTVPYVTPDIDPSVYFAEHFDSEESFENKWIISSAKKDGVESAIDR